MKCGQNGWLELVSSRCTCSCRHACADGGEHAWAPAAVNSTWLLHCGTCTAVPCMGCFLLPTLPTDILAACCTPHRQAAGPARSSQSRVQHCACLHCTSWSPIAIMLQCTKGGPALRGRLIQGSGEGGSDKGQRVKRTGTDTTQSGDETSGRQGGYKMAQSTQGQGGRPEGSKGTKGGGNNVGACLVRYPAELN